MRILLSTVLSLLCALSARADEIQFSDVVEASVVFRDDFDAARRYPHILKVFLRLENTHDSAVSWVANAVTGIEAELLDAAGKPVPQSGGVTSIRSGAYAYLLPYGSRLDWLISHGGIGMLAEATDKYALMIGGKGWLIPIATASSYSLRIRLRGLPWERTAQTPSPRDAEVLLDLSPVELELTK
jgi:hypothetical protein